MVVALIEPEHQCCQTQSPAHLWQALNSLAEDGGLWNGRAFADWVAQLKGKPIHRQRGWEYLPQMNFRQLVPRVQHDEADTLAAARMEKKLNLEQARLPAEYPEAEIEVWAMDEHRLGLKPIQRRVWAGQGEQPIAAVKWRFQWLWLYGFVHPLVWGNLLVDSTKSQAQPIQQSFSRFRTTFWRR
jgi:hypothetical protein